MKCEAQLPRARGRLSHRDWPRRGAVQAIGHRHLAIGNIIAIKGPIGNIYTYILIYIYI